MSKLSLSSNYHSKKYRGEIEFIVKDRNGNVIDVIREPNIVKIFAKEILSHTFHHDKIWDPSAASGAGAWTRTDAVVGTDDPSNDFTVKYILVGASFDDNGVPLDFNDDRFYTLDTVTGLYVPNQLTPGATNNGGLINPVPVSSPGRPLKRIENVSYEATYQPSGSPLLQDDVRAINNIAVLETTLTTDEYNGLGLTDSDQFTITEVALAAGKELDDVGSCECSPRKLFLEGRSSDNTAITVTASGTNVISIDPSEVDVDLIKEGDQIYLSTVDSDPISNGTDSLDQVSPFYLVTSKLVGGRDIQLDRIPTDVNETALSGTFGVFRDTLRIFSS